jgi:hypothetical protein
MTRRCKVCKAVFTPTSAMQTWCCVEHGVILGEKALAKSRRMAAMKVRRADKVQREKLKSKADYAREAQTEFNKFIRLRDADKPCISCGKHHTGQYHAGHYLSVGARPELRFEEQNVYKQCSVCNNHLSGNIVMYRMALVKQFGLQLVDWLESHHEPKRYTKEDLVAIKKHYITRAKELHD